MDVMDGQMDEWMGVLCFRVSDRIPKGNDNIPDDS